MEGLNFSRISKLVQLLHTLCVEHLAAAEVVGKLACELHSKAGGHKKLQQLQVGKLNTGKQ